MSIALIVQILALEPQSPVLFAHYDVSLSSRPTRLLHSYRKKTVLHFVYLHGKYKHFYDGVVSGLFAGFIVQFYGKHQTDDEMPQTVGVQALFR